MSKEIKERKAFNFYRSYYEIAMELPENERLIFLEAILKKQFENIDTELNGMAKFAYLSQKHSIEKQVEGYKHGLKGGAPPKGSNNPPLKGNYNQEKDKGEEQEKDKVKEQYVSLIKNEFDRFWDYYGKKVDRNKCFLKWKKLSEKDKNAIRKHLPKYIASQPDIQFRKNPLTYLNGKTYLDEEVQSNLSLDERVEKYGIHTLNEQEKLKYITS